MFHLDAAGVWRPTRLIECQIKSNQINQRKSTTMQRHLLLIGFWESLQIKKLRLDRKNQKQLLPCTQPCSLSSDILDQLRTLRLIIKWSWLQLAAQGVATPSGGGQGLCCFASH